MSKKEELQNKKISDFSDSYNSFCSDKRKSFREENAELVNNGIIFNHLINLERYLIGCFYIGFTSNTKVEINGYEDVIFSYYKRFPRKLTTRKINEISEGIISIWENRMENLRGYIKSQYPNVNDAILKHVIDESLYPDSKQEARRFIIKLHDLKESLYVPLYKIIGKSIVYIGSICGIILTILKIKEVIC